MVLGVALALVSLFLMAYALLDAATSRTQDVRALPKPLWIVVVVLLPVVGAALWFAFGRPKAGSPRAVPRVLPPDVPTSAPDDDEAFLRDLRRRAEEQRRRAQEQRRDEGGPAATA